MEAHQLPQNVTSFQFKLVGNMTLKQFLYLASGLTIAYLSFVFLASPIPILAWPIIITSALLGVAFAFLPVADRPLDKWLKAYLKAVYSPTKMVWIKDNKTYLENPLFNQRLAFLGISSSSQQVITPKLAQPAVVTPPQPKGPEPLPTSNELAKTVELARQAQVLQNQIVATERQLSQFKSAPASTPGSSEQINQILGNLQKLVNEASEIKQRLATVTHAPTEVRQRAQVKVVSAPPPKTTQLTLTTFPNVINGIVTDAESNYLDGVVVVIYNKEGLPVRALKTNKLGQFSGSTPLPNGIYRVELEKENLVFDVLQIELKGSVLLPINIAAKRLVGA